MIQLERSKSDDWEKFMEADLAQSFAFNLILAKTEAGWWIARRQSQLSAIVREVLAELPTTNL